MPDDQRSGRSTGRVSCKIIIIIIIIMKLQPLAKFSTLNVLSCNFMHVLVRVQRI